MAIDDNTSYELTGAQVKDLANKIKGKADDNIFVGATSAAPGSKGIVPAPQAGDDTKYLKGDGTWSTVSGGGSVSITNTPAASYSAASTTDVMGQQGTYLQVHTSNDGIKISGSASPSANTPAATGIQIGGGDAWARKDYSIAIGSNSVANGYGTVVIGGSTVGRQINHTYSVALGFGSTATADSAVSVGDGSSNANYGKRKIVNVKDGVSDSDAATVGQLNSAISGIGWTTLYASADLESASTATLCSDATLMHPVTGNDAYVISNLLIAVDKSNGSTQEYVDYVAVAREYVFDQTQQAEPKVDITLINQATGGTIKLSANFTSTTWTISRGGGGGGGNSVTIVLSDLSPHDYFPDALDEMYRLDPQAAQQYEMYLNGQYDPYGSGLFAFLNEGLDHYLQIGELGDYFRNGYKVNIVNGLNRLDSPSTLQNMVISGMVLNVSNSNNEYTLLSINSDNVGSQYTGLMSVRRQLQVGSNYNYGLYTGTLT